MTGRRSDMPIEMASDADEARTHRGRPCAVAQSIRPQTSPLLEISNALVRVYKEMLGRGPMKARTCFAGTDLLVVVLEDTMTRSERNLVALGEGDQVRCTRHSLASSFEAKLRGAVETVLGRPTLAFASGIDIQRDLVFAVFKLEASAGEPPGRGFDGLASARPGAQRVSPQDPHRPPKTD
jgi:uncharacterized protein YbcI